MAILWLLLGFLSAVGSSSTDPPTSGAIVTSSTIPAQSTTVVVVPTQVAPSDNASAVNASTLANTGPSLTATPSATTIAPQSATFTIPPKEASTGTPTDVTSGPVTSSEGAPTVTKQSTVPLKVTPTNPYSASTADNSNSSVPGSSKHPEGTATTEPTQLTNVTKDGSPSTNSTAIPQTPLWSTKPSKDTTISTQAVSSSASPSLKMTSSTIAGGVPEITTKSKKTLFPRHSTTISATTAELSTSMYIEPQKTTMTTTINKQSENIKVECTNLMDKASYVKIQSTALTICDANGKFTDVQATQDIIKKVCKALNPEYQKKQYRCIIRLAKVNNEELAITEAFIESHMDSKDLYTQLKRTGANSSLFTYDGAVLEDEDVVSIPLISAIVSLAVLLLIIAAAYGCWHQRKARKREQRLTEELQTMENGYHDNPTLEVMETSPEMQEKKGGPNGELGDSWIVPLDNLTREDLEEEEDTHL